MAARSPAESARRWAARANPRHPQAAMARSREGSGHSLRPRIHRCLDRARSPAQTTMLISNAEMARSSTRSPTCSRSPASWSTRRSPTGGWPMPVERWPEDVAYLYRRGTPPKLPGAGPALTTKLAELARPGSLAYHDRMRAQVPQRPAGDPEDPRGGAADRQAAARGARHRLRGRPAGRGRAEDSCAA